MHRRHPDFIHARVEHHLIFLRIMQRIAYALPVQDDAGRGLFNIRTSHVPAPPVLPTSATLWGPSGRGAPGHSKDLADCELHLQAGNMSQVAGEQMLCTLKAGAVNLS